MIRGLAALALALGGGLAKYVCFPLLWAYVDDVAAICLAALERAAEANGIWPADVSRTPAALRSFATKRRRSPE